MFRDKKDGLVALTVKHHPFLQQKIQQLPALIQALFPTEKVTDESTMPGFDFCAVHMSQYNRYAENVWDLYYLTSEY
jgi:hypothetical protein